MAFSSFVLTIALLFGVPRAPSPCISAVLVTAVLVTASTGGGGTRAGRSMLTPLDTSSTSSEARNDVGPLLPSSRSRLHELAAWNDGTKAQCGSHILKRMCTPCKRNFKHNALLGKCSSFGECRRRFFANCQNKKKRRYRRICMRKRPSPSDRFISNWKCPMSKKKYQEYINQGRAGTPS